MYDKKRIIDEGKRVIGEEMKSLERVSSSIDERFFEAVKMIAGASKLIVSGVGKSGMIAHKIAATFSSIGIPALFMHPVDALHGDLGIVCEDDVALLLSKSGSTDDIVRLVPYLRSRKAKLIAIVGNTDSFLSEAADVSLDASVEKEACPFNQAPTSSAVAALAIGDALAMTCMEVNGFTLEDFSKLHPLGQIGRNITLKVKDVMHSGNDLPVVSGKSSFRDAVIEITNKRLGCVCICDWEKRLLGILTDGDVRRVLHEHEDLRGLNISSIMTTNPVTVSPEAFLSEAMALMESRESQISVLPVVDSERKCAGVVRIHDIIRSGI